MSRSKNRRNQGQQNQNQASQTKKTSENPQNPSSRMGEIVSANQPSPTPTHSNEPSRSAAEESHRVAERGYWARQVHLSKCLNSITGAGTIVALIGLVFVGWTLISNEDATFQANRAWLAVLNVDFTGIPPNLGWTIDIKNYGRDPATDVNFSVPIITWPVLHNDAENMETMDWPNDNTCRYIDANRRGIVIFPDASGYKKSSTIEATAAFTPFLKGVLDGTRGNLIIGCVSYKTFSRIKYTQYCFLGERMPDGSIAYTVCDEGPYSN